MPRVISHQSTITHHHEINHPMQGASPKHSPVVILGVGIVAVSTGAIFARLADAPALVTAAYRVGLATLILLPFALWKSGAELRGLSRRQVGLAGLSGLFLALHFALWIASLDYTSVANSVVLVNTVPLWVALLAPLVTSDRIGRRTVLSAVLCVGGAAAIGAEGASLGGDVLRGDMLAVGGAMAAAVYIVLGRKLRANLSLLSYVTVCYGCAAVTLWLLVLILRLPVLGFSTQTYWAFLGMAVISQVVGHTSYNWSLKWFSSSLVAVSLLGEPIGSSILAYFIFGEELTMVKLAGGGLILVGIYLAAAPKKKPD